MRVQSNEWLAFYFFQGTSGAAPFPRTDAVLQLLELQLFKGKTVRIELIQN